MNTDPANHGFYPPNLTSKSGATFLQFWPHFLPLSDIISPFWTYCERIGGGGNFDPYP